MYVEFIEDQEVFKNIENVLEENLGEVCEKVKKKFPELERKEVRDLVLGCLLSCVFSCFYDWEIKSILGDLREGRNVW